jgi:apolipoprotein D and lipocalin family protein
MNVPIPLPLPASPPRVEAVEHGDLDARIRQAEGRLLAREDNLHRDFLAIGLQLRQSLQPRRLLIPALGVGAAVVALLWLFRHRPGQAKPSQRADAALPRAHPAGGTWVPLAGMLWPLLPASWRAQVNPSVAQLALGTGLPLLDLLMARPVPRPLVTAGPLEPDALAGLWYELGSLHASDIDRVPVRWRLTLREDGSVDLRRQPTDAPGHVNAPCGVAVAVAGTGSARWRVSHWPPLLRWLPLAWHQQAVLHLDDAATELLFGSPERDQLRLWARQPSLPRARLDAMLALARERGFAVDRLRFAEHIAHAGPLPHDFPNGN